MVMADLNILEHAQRVLCQHGSGAVERDEVRRDGAAVDAHEADGKAGGLLAGKSRLEETDYALTLFSGAKEKDVGLAGIVDRELVGRDERYASPGKE
jgi:hypothetical protein